MDINVSAIMLEADILKACVEWAKARLPAIEGHKLVAEFTGYGYDRRVIVTMVPDSPEGKE